MMESGKEIIQMESQVSRDVMSINTSVESSKKAFRKRVLFIVMSFLGFFNIFTMRVDLSVAIVAMVKSDTDQKTNITEGCPMDIQENSNKIDSSGYFLWDTVLQGHILGSFFYGYVAGLFPGGPLSEKFGGEWIFGLGEFLMALSSILVPAVASTNWGAEGLIVLRIICGFGAGVTYPAMHNLIARWIPKSERSRAATFIWSGVQVGIVVGMPLSGALAESFGWETVFYAFGGLGTFWFLIWCFLIKGNHFVVELNDEEGIKEKDTKKKALPFPPLKHIFVTPAFLALTLVHFGQSWGYITLMTEIPSYLNNVHHYSVSSNGLLSALPYVFMFVIGTTCGWIADWLINSKRLTVTKTRKLFQFIGHWVPAIALLILAYGINCGDYIIAVVLLCVAVGFNGASFSGYQINHVELSPNYAGTLMGLTGAVANTAGFVSPYIVGVVVEGNQTLEAWSIVFVTASVICVVLNIVFLIFGTSERQWWDTHWTREKDSTV